MFNLEHFYCFNCGWRIVVGGARKFMWGAFAAIIVIGVILFQFIIPRHMLRVLVLFALWILFIEIVEIVMSLIIVNVARFSKPDVSVSDDDL